MQQSRMKCFCRLLAMICAAAWMSFSSPVAEAAGENRQHTIAVSQFIKHPALDALLRGFMEHLESAQIPVKYVVHIANGDQALNESIARDIGAENPDLVLAISTPSSQACLKVLPNTTILFSAVTDPVGAGLVESLSKPGARITGMTDMSPIEQQIKLITGLVPELKTIGVIYNNNESNSVSLVRIIEQECARQGIGLVKKAVGNGKEVATAAQSLVGNCDAIYAPTDNTVVSVIESVARICAKHRLPLFAADVDSIPRGAVATLAIDYYSMGRQTGRMAERIFAGEAPSSMPVEWQEDLRIHVNTKAAEVMGVELPVDLLQAADVIYDSFPE